MTAEDISQAFGIPQKHISNHIQEKKAPSCDVCVKEKVYNPSSQRDPYDQLMFLTHQLHNELQAKFANQSTNIAKQKVLPDRPVHDKSLSVGLIPQKCENAEEQLTVLSETPTCQGPVAEIDWERLPELYIREEDDEIMHRSSLEADSKEVVQEVVNHITLVVCKPHSKYLFCF